MDENSCEGEYSDRAENGLDGQRGMKTDDVSQLESAGVRIDFKDESNSSQIPESCIPSIGASASGPSTVYPSITLVDNRENTVEEPREEVLELEPTVQQDNSEAIDGPLVPAYEEPQDDQPRVRLSPETEEQLSAKTVSVGPPPSYSFVMKQKKKFMKPAIPLPVAPFKSPPPTYSGNQGLCLPPEESRVDRVCNLPSFSEPLWRSHSQPALCPRCGIIILTATHSHDSIVTHVTALALCLFGCWPCCFLPYCMSVCKNTCHHCPICQYFLGSYSPW